MSPSQKELDAEAQYDDEIQYSRDPLNLEELEAKYVTSIRAEHHY